MKEKLNWQDERIVNVFDEVTLWSAPFGRLLLENIPMKPDAKILDLGFGTGFPLVELSQRFGENSKIFGMDIWEAGVLKTKEKIKIFQLENIEIIEQSAERIPLKNEEVDLICSNLGVNNFDQKMIVLEECFRVLKKGGSLCLTTNPIGTFEELFEIFKEVFQELKLENELGELDKYISHRGTPEAIEKELNQVGLKLSKSISDKTNLRFVNALAVFNHALIRIGFLESWEKLIPNNLQTEFFEIAQKKIDSIIKDKGEFKMSIPMFYFEFKK